MDAFLNGLLQTLARLVHVVLHAPQISRTHVPFILPMPSFDRPHDPTVPPSPWMVRFAHLIPAGGKVLDVAAGHGRHTRFFAERGNKLVAVDIDAGDLEGFADQANISVLEKDLETGEWPFAPNEFEAVVVANYLHRPLFPRLIETLSVNGVLLYETFARGNEQFGRPRNPDFLLAPGELLNAFADKLMVVAYEHGVETDPRPSVRQRLCAIKTTSSSDLLPDLFAR